MSRSNKGEGVGRDELKQMVAESDTGGRHPTGAVALFLMLVALAWSLFQLWYASPLPFTLGVFVLNDTEARAIHLAFAVFLSFTAYPAFSLSHLLIFLPSFLCICPLSSILRLPSSVISLTHFRIQSTS